MSGQRPATVRVDTVVWDPDRKEIRINAGKEAITLQHEAQDPLFDPLLLALGGAARHTDEPDVPTQMTGGMTSDEAFQKLAKLYGQYGEKRFFYRAWCERHENEESKCRELLKEALGWEAALMSTTAEIKEQVGSREWFARGPVPWLRSQFNSLIKGQLNPLKTIWNLTNRFFQNIVGQSKWTTLLTLTSLVTFIYTGITWLMSDIMNNTIFIARQVWNISSVLCQIVTAIPSSIVLSMCGAIFIGVLLDEVATQAQSYFPRVVNSADDNKLRNIMNDHKDCMFKLLNNEFCAGDQSELEEKLTQIQSTNNLAAWFLRQLKRPRPQFVHYVRLVPHQ